MENTQTTDTKEMTMQERIQFEVEKQLANQQTTVASGATQQPRQGMLAGWQPQPTQAITDLLPEKVFIPVKLSVDNGKNIIIYFQYDGKIAQSSEGLIDMIGTLIKILPVNAYYPKGGEKNKGWG